jgi:hypothetical protein
MGKWKGSGRRGRHLHQITDVKHAHCRYCYKRIDRSATTCLYCQRNVSPWATRHTPFLIVGSVLMSLFLMAVVLNILKLFQH